MERLSEDIYGNIATVYHRTSTPNLIDSVNSTGFKPGNVSRYGKGFYSTYTIEAQCKQGMIQAYGSYLYKFAANTTNYFFFDYSEFEKTAFFKEWNKNHPGHQIDKSNFIHFQMYRFQIAPVKEHSDSYYRVSAIDSTTLSCTLEPLNNKKIKKSGFAHSYDLDWQSLYNIVDRYYLVDTNTGEYSSIRSYSDLEVGSVITPISAHTFRTRKYFTDNINSNLIGKRMSSNAAFYASNEIPNFRELVKGIVYTGNTDGTCLVAYDLSTIKPIAEVKTEDLDIISYFIEESLWCSDNGDNSANIVFSCDLQSLSSLSSDYDIAEQGGTEETSNIYLAVVGKDFDIAADAENLLSINGFDIENGNGIYIEYNGDEITPEIAIQNAYKRWTNTEENNSELDSYDIDKFLKDNLSGVDIEYVILAHAPNGRIDDLMEDAIAAFLPIPISHMNDKEFLDSTGNEYQIFFVDDYNYSSKAGRDWVSSRGQRTRDKQLDLSFEEKYESK